MNDKFRYGRQLHDFIWKVQYCVVIAGDASYVQVIYLQNI